MSQTSTSSFGSTSKLSVVVAAAAPYRHWRESHKQVGISKKPKRRRRIKVENGEPVIRCKSVSLAAFVWSICLVLLSVCATNAGVSPTPRGTAEVDQIISGTTTLEIDPSQRPQIIPPTMPPPPLTPCDRSRKVFTNLSSGEISDGPTGANYTQASNDVVITNFSVSVRTWSVCLAQVDQ